MARLRALLPGLLLAYATGSAAAAAAERLEVAAFARGDLEHWEAKRFKGETQYRARDGGLCADSKGAGSGLVREIHIDLTRTPVLHWSWRLERALAPGDEQSKPGDDYAARVYVVFSGGPLFWRTRAINYVWSAAQPAGTIWPNAFTANAQMVAAESGSAHAGEWVAERRDVRADFHRLFGADAMQADAVAIMTDTDNGGGSAAACYGDIWFGSE